MKQSTYSCPLLISTANMAGRLFRRMKPTVKSSSWTSSVQANVRDIYAHVIYYGVCHSTCTFRTLLSPSLPPSTPLHIYTMKIEMDLGAALKWSHPPSIRTRTSGCYRQVLWASTFRNFLGAGLGTRRNSLAVPLVWCWYPNSNLDHISYLALSMAFLARSLLYSYGMLEQWGQSDTQSHNSTHFVVSHQHRRVWVRIHSDTQHTASHWTSEGWGHESGWTPPSFSHIDS